MTERGSRQDVVIKYVRTAVGAVIFIFEVTSGTARPVVLGACLLLMGYEGAAYLDRKRKQEKE